MDVFYPAGVEEHAFCSRRLARVNVRCDADVPHFVQPGCFLWVEVLYNRFLGEGGWVVDCCFLDCGRCTGLPSSLTLPLCCSTCSLVILAMGLAMCREGVGGEGPFASYSIGIAKGGITQRCATGKGGDSHWRSGVRKWAEGEG